MKKDKKRRAEGREEKKEGRRRRQGQWRAGHEEKKACSYFCFPLLPIVVIDIIPSCSYLLLETGDTSQLEEGDGGLERRRGTLVPLDWRETMLRQHSLVPNPSPCPPGGEREEDPGGLRCAQQWTAYLPLLEKETWTGPSSHYNLFCYRLLMRRRVGP